MKKKILVIALALLVSIGGISFAEDIGLTVGVELGILDFSDIDNHGVDIIPFIEFYTDSLADGLELTAGLEIPITVGIAGEDPIIEVGFYADVLYSLPLSSDMSLGFGLFAGLYSDGLSDDGSIAFDVPLIPRFRLDNALDGLGDFYVELALPFGGINSENVELTLGLNLMAGLFMDNGFGIEAGIAGMEFGPLAELPGIDFGIDDGNDFSLDFITVRPSFSYEFIFASLDVIIPVGDGMIEAHGVPLIPGVEIDFSGLGVEGLNVWAALPIYGIGSSAGEIKVGLTLGASFSF